MVAHLENLKEQDEEQWQLQHPLENVGDIGEIGEITIMS